MLTHDEYLQLLHMAEVYVKVDPAPDSRYGKRLSELVTVIEQYERAHVPLTQPQVDEAIRDFDRRHPLA
jgi:antitoxin component HigA of HigAB toxin-antitoxin module